MRATISTANGTMKINGITPRAIAMMAALGKAGRPLAVKEIIDGMTELGVIPLSQNEHSEVSNICQRLLDIGAMYHPQIPGGNWQYCLGKEIDIKIEV